MEAELRKSIILWSIVLPLTTAFMLFLLLTGETSLNVTLIFFLSVLKFLSGFGIAASITSFVIFILTKFESKFQGVENRKRMINFTCMILLVFIIYLIYEGPIKIYQSFTQTGNVDNIFDKLLFIYGIVSLMYSIYLKPLLKNEFLEINSTSTGEMVKKGVVAGIRGVKKRVFMWRKNYAKAQLQDQISMKEFLNEWRQRLAIIVMPFLGLGSLVFTPIAAIIIIMWIYIFFISSDRPLKFEMILLFGSFAAITIISCLFPFILNFTSFYSTIETNYYWIYITNFIGSLIASILYLQKILQPLRKQRAQQKIQDLKESQKELKDQQKELVKKQKQMKKELSKAKKTSDEKG